MNKFIFTIIFFCGFFSIKAQDLVQVSVGASYSNQAFYTLSNNEINTLNNESWDLAFTTGPADAGIHYNESAKISFTGPVPVLALYLAPINDFSTVIDPMSLTDSLYNGEVSWEDGALNSVKEEGDPSDYGWGVYNPNNQVIEGTYIFALKLRDDSWKKIRIESLDNDVYTMKYASLDGANETTVTIDKNDFQGSPFALFSFSTETAVASPANWDLLFTRYISAIDVGGEITQYPVTGVLSGPGVEVAQANNVDPFTVGHEAYLDSMETQIDVIGQDWKYFDFTVGWVIDLQRAFFIKLPDNHLWKAVFTDFAGSSSGNMDFIKTDLGQLTTVSDPTSNFIDFGVFPNPVTDEFNLSFSLKEQRADIQVHLVNTLGQVVWNKAVDGNSGLNVLNFQAPDVPSGIYHLIVGNETDLWPLTIFLK